MAAPANELQRAIYQALIADLSLAAIIGPKVFDRVPRGDEARPYITIGEGIGVEDGSDCVSIMEYSFDVHVWSDGQGGFKEANEIAHAVKGALHEVDLDLGPHGLIDIRLESLRRLRDPNEITSHIVMTFDAMVEEI